MNINRVIRILFSPLMTLVSGIFIVLSLVNMFFQLHWPVDPAWVSIAISGVPLAFLAIRRLFTGEGITSALLITIAMFAAIYIGEIFAAGEVAFIMALGEFLEGRTLARAKRGIEKLMARAPKLARRIENHAYLDIPVSEVQVGDLLRVLPGDLVPVDGIVRSGASSIDQSFMTGESLPVDVGEGDALFAGTVNSFGALDIEATNIAAESAYERMLHLVQEAGKKKAPIHRMADRWAKILVPIALGLAILTWILTGELVRGVTVLIVFCPCALVLATPTAIMAAVGQSAQKGVLFKSGQALELLGRSKTMVFDKTGTLTQGKLQLKRVLPAVEGLSEAQLLTQVAALESHSEHPLAKAIVAAQQDQGGAIKAIENFQMYPGRGIEGQFQGTQYYCGSESYLASQGLALSAEWQETIQAERKAGGMPVLLGTKDRLQGVVVLSDTLREETRSAMERLKSWGYRLILLSGDHRDTAHTVAEACGITEVEAELLPEDKMRIIGELQAKYGLVCMVGDGVNDAPALKAADIGIAMGSMGSDIAVEAADVALMSDAIGRIPYMMKLSKATVGSIKLNILMALGINLLAIFLAFLGVLGPISGALVHNAGAILVILNAASLYDRKFEAH